MILNNSKADQLNRFIETDPELKEYLSSTKDWSHLKYVALDPLRAAVVFRKVEILDLLLSKFDMAVNARYEDGIDWSFNALSWAVTLNKVDCVRVLLKHGADMDKGGYYHGCPFQNAAELCKLCKEGKIGVINSDDCITRLQEEETKRRKGRNVKNENFIG